MRLINSYIFDDVTISNGQLNFRKRNWKYLKK
jgi:hypothetical protein